jgi:hypothetical protein
VDAAEEQTVGVHPAADGEAHMGVLAVYLHTGDGAQAGSR